VVGINYVVSTLDFREETVRAIGTLALYSCTCISQFDEAIEVIDRNSFVGIRLLWMEKSWVMFPGAPSIMEMLFKTKIKTYRKVTAC